MKVDFYRHNVTEEDRQEVQKVLNTWFLTTGEWTQKFEEELAKYLEIPYSVGVSSCTSALQIALKIAGVEEGDEVITCPLTFISTSNSILYCNATPVFVDSDKYTGCIDTTQINQKLNGKTKAILPVHIYGQLCNIEELLKIDPSIQVVEDCAHALETPSRGQLGLSCYSFYPIKAITSGEGGAVACWTLDQKNKAEILRLNGMDKDAWKRYALEGRVSTTYKHWDMPILGFKANMTNIQAALVIGQLRRVEELRRQREIVFDRYYKELLKIEEIELPRIERPHSKLMFTFWVKPEKRDAMLLGLQEKGVGVGVHYNPVHLTTYYRKRFGYKPGDFPNAERIGASTVSIPCYSSLTKEEQDYVIASIKEIIKEW